MKLIEFLMMFIRNFPYLSMISCSNGQSGMNVIDVPRKINFIPDLMFPIAPLSDASLTLGLAAGSNMFAFYQPPPTQPTAL